MRMVMPVMPRNKKQQLISQGYEDATTGQSQPVIVSAIGSTGRAEQLSSIPLSWAEARRMSDHLWQSGRAPMLVKVAGGWTVYALPVPASTVGTGSKSSITASQYERSVNPETQDLELLQAAS